MNAKTMKYVRNSFKSRVVKIKLTRKLGCQCNIFHLQNQTEVLVHISVQYIHPGTRDMFLSQHLLAFSSNNVMPCSTYLILLTMMLHLTNTIKGKVLEGSLQDDKLQRTYKPSKARPNIPIRCQPHIYIVIYIQSPYPCTLNNLDFRYPT
jgi:hypothetical protein